MKTIHKWLDLDTGEAYDRTQYDDQVKDGDVIVCNGGKSVAILIEAWPAIVKGEQGHFHGMNPGVTWENIDGGKYKEAYDIAMAQ